MSHDGNEKLNEILAGLLTSYQGLQALAEVQRDEFMAEITDETGKIDLVKVAARAKRLSDKHAEQEQPKHHYEVNGIDFVTRLQKREEILKGLDVIIEEVKFREDSEVAVEWLKGLTNWARCTKGYTEQIESFASSTEETNIAEKIGRGLVKPVIEYDQDVRVIKQCVENVQAAMSRLGDDCQLMLVEDYLTAHLKHVTEVKYNRKPVLDLKQIAAIMRTMVAEDGIALPTHCMIDLTRMADSLDVVIAQHVGEDLPVSPTSEELRSRMGWVIEALGDAVEAHPLDINQDKLKEVLLWLRSVLENNRGHHNLGKEGYIVVPTAENVPAEVIDSIRGYLIAYGQGDHMASELRSMAALRGDLAFNNMPEWFASTWGHTSKGGFAALIYHTMTEVGSQENPKAIHISSADLGKLEEQIRNGNPMALIDHINTATEKASND